MRILRLVGEALDQGGAATQEDLAKALGVTARTIRSDIAALEAQGYRLGTRGRLRGMGRGQTHKAAILELHLKRYTYTEIMQRTRHSAYAIKCHIRTFGRLGRGLSGGLTEQGSDQQANTGMRGTCHVVFSLSS